MNKLKKPHALSILLVSSLFIILPFISSGQILNNNSGYLSFYDANGEQAVSPVIFSNSTKGKIAALNLSNNNIFTAFLTDEINSQGMFTITDQRGGQIQAPANFAVGTVTDFDLTILENKNIMIVYADINAAKGFLAIYDAGGKLISSSTLFTTVAVDGITSLKLNNSNILVFYNNKTLKKGCFQIYDQDGRQIKSETIFSDNPVAAISPARIADDKIFVAYSDTGTKPQGMYFILTQTGNLSHYPFSFSAGQVNVVSALTMSNTNVMIAYSDAVDKNFGKATIFSKTGSLVSDAISFNKTETKNISISELFNQNISIAYIDGEDQDKGKFVIVSPDGRPVKEPVIFSADPTGYVAGTQLSNHNQLIAFNITSTSTCIEADWNYRLDTSICTSTGKQLKYWETARTCSGGVSHPVSEELSCANTQLVICQEADWTYKIEPKACPASNEQNKIWQKSKDCIGGISHATAEKIKCTYAPENKVVAIKNKALYNRLKGKIILNVDDSGKAYYVDADSLNLFYLGRPADAFRVMREQGLGIKNSDLAKIPAKGQTANRANISLINYLKGKILLQVESKGEAWYVNPVDGFRYFLGLPSDAFAVMRNLGLGINNLNYDNLQK